MRRRSGANAITLLGGTTALLLLCVFTVVNIALLVLRRQPVDHEHFRTPTFLPLSVRPRARSSRGRGP